MKEDKKDTIPVLEAAKWLARMAAKDCVVSANERKLLNNDSLNYLLEDCIKFRKS